MLDLLKKHKGIIIKTIIIVFISCLLIAQIPFWIGKWRVFIPTEMDESDILSFLGDFISAIGSILLGWYAIKQTDKANNTNDRLLAIEEQRHREDHQPSVIVESVILHNTTFTQTPLHGDKESRLYYVDANYEHTVNDERACIEIKIVNTGNTGIFNCQVKTISSFPEEMASGIQNFDEFWSAPFTLLPESSISLHLYTYPNVIERFATRKIKYINLTVNCVNRFNEKYTIFLKLEGNVELHGNRYEDMLGPTPHPIVWEVQSTPTQ